MAPITIERPFSSMPVRPSIWPMSMMSDGLASRSFIAGISEWPPARSLASGFLASRLAACRTVRRAVIFEFVHRSRSLIPATRPCTAEQITRPATTPFMAFAPAAIALTMLW